MEVLEVVENLSWGNDQDRQILKSVTYNRYLSVEYYYVLRSLKLTGHSSWKFQSLNFQNLRN